MLKKLQAMLQQKEARRSQLGQTAQTTESVEELRSLNTELETLNGEIAEIRGMIAEAEAQNTQAEERYLKPNQIIGTYQRQAPKAGRAGTDSHESEEYRSAFMDYVQNNAASELLEFRNTTQLGDVGAVIPTTILNRIVQKLRESGRIWSRVRQTSVQGGLQIPISSVKPTATWTGPGNMANKSQQNVSQYITFSYHKLQCRVAVELVASTVSLSIFEDMVVENVYEAMIVALDEAIIKGTGNLQPLGIINDTAIPADQQIAITPAEMGNWQAWNVVLAKQGRRYRSGSVLIMADEDYNKYIQGAVDANNQPIARIDRGIQRNGQPREYLLHREVLAVEDLLPSIDDANVGDVVAILVNLDDYLMNSNMQLTYRRYFDEGTDEWIDKATLIADGKLADRNGVVLIRKGAAPTLLAAAAKKNA